MTSAQTMLKSARALALLLAMLAVGACAPSDELTAPGVLTSPYQTVRGEPLWAVVPLRNESGTSTADTLVISDEIVAAIQQVRGIRCLPLNRTLETLRATDADGAITSPAEALALARALGADGVIVGSITAYDPYDPPVLGLSLALYTLDTPASRATIDPRALTMAYSDADFGPASNFGTEPGPSTSIHLDGRNHDVQMRLRTFADGRVEAHSAIGWRMYLASMDLYTRFAAHRAVDELLDHEWLRLARERGRADQG